MSSGFKNLANTCFVSSVLQCVFHTQALCDALLKCRERPHGEQQIQQSQQTTSFSTPCKLLYIADNITVLPTGHKEGRVCLVCTLQDFRVFFRKLRSYKIMI